MKKLVLLGCVFLAACSTLKTSGEYIMRGNGYLKDGKTEAAIDAFNKALVLNSSNMDAYEARGAAYFFKGHYDLAQADFERVLNTDPYRISVYTAYASVLASKNDFNNALEVLNLVDKLGKATPETYFARAGVYYMLGRYDKAVADYTRVLQERVSADVLNARGNAYAQWGKPQQAQRDFEQARTPNIPQHLNAYTELK